MPTGKPHGRRPKDWYTKKYHRKGWKGSYTRSEIELFTKLSGSVVAHEREEEKGRIRQRQKRKAVRGDVQLEALQHYSIGGEMRCVLCGFSDPDALVIHTRENQILYGHDMLTKLKAEGWPEGPEVLCRNCVYVTTGRGSDYALKEEVFRHYPHGNGGTQGELTYSEENQSIKYTCRQCDHAIFVLSAHKCPKCGQVLPGKVRCVKCGFSDMRALTLELVQGGGAKHRKELGVKGGLQFYQYLKDHDYPQTPQLQVLCDNCQFIKERETFA